MIQHKRPWQFFDCILYTYETLLRDLRDPHLCNRFLISLICSFFFVRISFMLRQAAVCWNFFSNSCRQHTQTRDNNCKEAEFTHTKSLNNSTINGKMKVKADHSDAPSLPRPAGPALLEARVWKRSGSPADPSGRQRSH